MTTTDHSTLAVAIDAGPLHGHRTGVGVATAAMIDALSARGDVTVRPYLVSFRSNPADGQVRLPLPGIVASHVWSRSSRPGADRWLRGVDVVHGTNYVVPPTRLPSVVSVYDCWFLAHPELADPLVRRAGRRLQRAVDAGAWVHVGVDAIGDQVRALLGTDRVRTVPLGVPPSLGPNDELVTPDGLGHLAGRPFVVAIGTQERRKDLALLIEAFGLVAADLADVALVIAGAPGNAVDEVDTAVGALAAPVAARVHRLGMIDEATKHWLLRHAATLAISSLDEGFGFPILEGHASRTPVVATAVGSIPEVAGDAALLVHGRDPAVFAAALQRSLTDAGCRLGLIESGLRNLARFDWADTAAGLVELYATAIEDAR